MRRGGAGDTEAEIKMKMTGDKTVAVRSRFAACTAGRRLLSIGLQVARRAPASESISKKFIFLPAFFPVTEARPTQLTIDNLKRCGIFRGKISRAKLNTKTHLEPRTHLRQTYE
jgi:hypothetical protein